MAHRPTVCQLLSEKSSFFQSLLAHREIVTFFFPIAMQVLCNSCAHNFEAQVLTLKEDSYGFKVVLVSSNLECPGEF